MNYYCTESFEFAIAADSNNRKLNAQQQRKQGDVNMNTKLY